MKYICKSFRDGEMVRSINVEACNSCEALAIFGRLFKSDSDCIVTCEEEGMNILEYIESLMDEGYTEEEAGRMADCIYNTDWDCDAEETYCNEYGYLGDGYDDYDYLEWADQQEEL